MGPMTSVARMCFQQEIGDGVLGIWDRMGIETVVVSAIRGDEGVSEQRMRCLLSVRQAIASVSTLAMLEMVEGWIAMGQLQACHYPG